MAKYVEVKNNNGTITIDDTYARLVKTRTISITAGTGVCPEADYYYIKGYVSDQYIMGSYCVQEVNLNSNEVLVAIRAKKQHANVAVLGGFISSKKYLVTLLGNVANTNVYKSDFLIDVYGSVPSSGGTRSGLEVFNASGTKIFDSDFYCMDVIGNYSYFNKGIRSFVDEPDAKYLSGYSIDDCAVVINSCINKYARHPRAAYTSLINVLYGVVFGTSIHLEKRVNEYISFLYDGGNIVPHGFSHSSTGVILSTNNI